MEEDIRSCTRDFDAADTRVGGASEAEEDFASASLKVEKNAEAMEVWITIRSVDMHICPDYTDRIVSTSLDFELLHV